MCRPSFASSCSTACARSSSRRRRSPWADRSATCAGASASSYATELRVPSEFDFAAQSLLYLPRRMPQPRSPDFADAVAAEVRSIVGRSHGRAFVLFTSYAMMHAVYETVLGSVPYPLHRAGDGAAKRAAQAVSEHAERGAAGDVVVLAGGRRRRRAIELRGHRQAAVCVTRRSDHGRTHRGGERRRRRCVQRVPGAAGDPQPAPGTRPVDPAPHATAASWPSSIRGCGRWAMAAGFWSRSRPRRLPTIWLRLGDFSALDVGLCQEVCDCYGSP